MRVMSTIGMRRACPFCSTSTAVGRFQTNPPFGRRTTSARAWGVTVTSCTVTGSADTSRASNTSIADRMHTFLLVSDRHGSAAARTASARQISPSVALARITSPAHTTPSLYTPSNHRPRPGSVIACPSNTRPRLHRLAQHLVAAPVPHRPSRHGRGHPGPREGGRWYEQGMDGGQCDWDRVLTWEPSRRLVVTWPINGQGNTTPTPPTPGRSRCGSPPAGPSRHCRAGTPLPPTARRRPGDPRGAHRWGWLEGPLGAVAKAAANGSSRFAQHLNPRDLSAVAGCQPASD